MDSQLPNGTYTTTAYTFAEWYRAYGSVPSRSGAQVRTTVNSGYLCETMRTDSLAKAICRNPANRWNDWFVVVFDFDAAQQRVFMDTQFPNRRYENGNMSFNEWQRRFGSQF